MARSQVARATLEQQAKQALQLFDNLYGDLPKYAQDLAIADFRHNGLDPESHGGDLPIYSFAQAYSLLQEQKVIGVCGGSRLEASNEPNERIYTQLNRFLGARLAENSWSVCTGGGPGKAMKGLPYCLKQGIVGSPNDPDQPRSVSVLSGLNDEAPHRYVDLAIRSPGDIAIREKMIIGLSKVVLVYPGHIGTYAEIFEMMMQNYVDGRGSYSTQPPSFIIVSYKDDRFAGGHYFAPLMEQLNNSQLAKLSKGETFDWVKLVILENPERLAAKPLEKRDGYFKRKAREIYRISENFYEARLEVETDLSTASLPASEGRRSSKAKR